MTHILHLDSSARGVSSHSRQVSGELVHAWLEAHPDDTMTYRDLGHQTLPFVTEEFIYAMYTPAEARTSEQKATLTLSDELISELKAADLIVVGVPMYNFDVPGVFKAYIDQVVRAGETFNPANYQGLLPNKKVVFVTARGGSGYGPGEAREGYNAQERTLGSAFGLMGITDQTYIHVENTSRGEDVTNGALAAARVKIQEFVAAV